MIVKRRKREKTKEEPYNGAKEVGRKVAIEAKVVEGWKATPKEDVPGYPGTERGIDKGKDLKEVEV